MTISRSAVETFDATSGSNGEVDEFMEDLIRLQWWKRRGRRLFFGFGREVSPSSWGSARMRRLNGADSVEEDGETCWLRVDRRAVRVLLVEEEGEEEGRANAQPWKIG